MAFATCSPPRGAYQKAQNRICVRRRRLPCMRVARDGDRVAVEFVGTLDDGTEFGRTTSGHPVHFTVGGGAVIRGFDVAVRGLQAGESRSVRVPAPQGYGLREAELVVEIPHSRIAPTERELIRQGRRVALDNGLVATVVEVHGNGNVVIDANHHLAGNALNFDIRLVKFASRKLPALPHGMARAIFALGSFWAAEHSFRGVDGVIHTCVGYVGGTETDPTYMDVVSGTTGHAEAVVVEYNPRKTSYRRLLKIFWRLLDDRALTKHRPGNDGGGPYRSAIFCLDDAQLQAARKSKADMNARLGRSVVTEVETVAEDDFWVAEDIHQSYIEKNAQQK